MNSASEIDVEKAYPNHTIATKLRRIADALENGTGFKLKIDNHNLYIPKDVRIDIEYEFEDNEHELEFEFKWKD